MYLSGIVNPVLHPFLRISLSTLRLAISIYSAATPQVVWSMYQCIHLFQGHPVHWPVMITEQAATSEVHPEVGATTSLMALIGGEVRFLLIHLKQLIIVCWGFNGWDKWPTTLPNLGIQAFPLCSCHWWLIPPTSLYERESKSYVCIDKVSYWSTPKKRKLSGSGVQDIPRDWIWMLVLVCKVDQAIKCVIFCVTLHAKQSFQSNKTLRKPSGVLTTYQGLFFQKTLKKEFKFDLGWHNKKKTL